MGASKVERDRQQQRELYGFACWVLSALCAGAAYSTDEVVWSRRNEMGQEAGRVLCRVGVRTGGMGGKERPGLPPREVLGAGAASLAQRRPPGRRAPDGEASHFLIMIHFHCD